MSGQNFWMDDEVLQRITRAYSREDDQFRTCPQCGNIAQQQSLSEGSKVIRELCCTNCSHLERETVVETTETSVEVTALPSKCQTSGVVSGEKLAVWLLLYDRYLEVM